MTLEPNAAFTGSIPENYDRYLGPVIFEPYARDVAERLASRKPKAVLEIACGTGIVTRQLQRTLGPNATIIATDLNAAMVDFARAKFDAAFNIEWETADAAALGFSDDSFDAVVCQFGLMFVPDKEAAMKEAFRVLRPGGVFLFNVWERMEQNPYAKIAHETIASFFDRDPPMFYETPFGFHDARAIRTMLRTAGFGAIESVPVKLTCRSRSAADFAIGLVRGTPISAAIVQAGLDSDAVAAAVAKKLTDEGGAAPFESTMLALVWLAERIPSV